MKRIDHACLGCGRIRSVSLKNGRPRNERCVACCKPWQSFTAETWMDKFGDWFVPVPETGCWIWMRSTAGKGYGYVHHEGESWRAHRLSYWLLRGELPPELDHLCRVRCCVNPDHLEGVTRRENVLRGASFMAAKAKQTHCLNGHEFKADNIYHNADGTRRCRTCTLAWQQRYYQGNKDKWKIRAERYRLQRAQPSSA